MKEPSALGASQLGSPLKMGRGRYQMVDIKIPNMPVGLLDSIASLW